MSSYLDWANDAADGLDQINVERDNIREALGSHSETNRILKQWAELVNNLGVLRNHDGLRIEVTPL